jgi:hypothetical protein
MDRPRDILRRQARLVSARRSGNLLGSRRPLASMRAATEFQHAQTARRVVEMS